jgi:hypothetical protein
VALGIFSLIVSIAVVLLNVSDFMTEIASRDLSSEDMRRFAWPFAEGLRRPQSLPSLQHSFGMSNPISPRWKAVKRGWRRQPAKRNACR